MYYLADPLGMLGAFAIVAAIYVVIFSVGVHIGDQEKFEGAPPSRLTDAPEYGGGRRAA